MREGIEKRKGNEMSELLETRTRSDITRELETIRASVERVFELLADDLRKGDTVFITAGRFEGMTGAVGEAHAGMAEDLCVIILERVVPLIGGGTVKAIPIEKKYLKLVHTP